MPRSLLNATQCPACLVGENHPSLKGERLIMVRFLEHDGKCYSQCLVCAGFWNEELKATPANYNEQKGWFEC